MHSVAFWGKPATYENNTSNLDEHGRDYPEVDRQALLEEDLTIELDRGLAATRSIMCRRSLQAVGGPGVPPRRLNAFRVLQS